jgi:hypothetical protein
LKTATDNKIHKSDDLKMIILNPKKTLRVIYLFLIHRLRKMKNRARKIRRNQRKQKALRSQMISMT